MIRLLQLLFCGHIHHWTTIRQVSLSYTEGGKDVANGTRFIQQCSKCGKVCKRDLI